MRGVKRMDVMTVYAVALDQKSRAMPLVDLNLVRDRLLEYGWVQDAHVSRRLPDTLLIRIVERTPAAVWQDRGQAQPDRRATASISSPCRPTRCPICRW